MKLLRTAIVALLIAAPAAAAGSGWFHVEILKDGWKETAVRVNLPMAAVSRALPLLPEPRLRQSRLQVGDAEVGAAELRSILRALDAGERALCDCGGDEIEATEEQGWIRFAIRDSWDGDVFNFSMPSDVVRALAGGSGAELDYLAAVNVVVARGGGEIALADADGAKVRVWIDDAPRGYERN